MRRPWSELIVPREYARLTIYPWVEIYTLDGTTVRVRGHKSKKDDRVYFSRRGFVHWVSPRPVNSVSIGVRTNLEGLE